MERVHIEAKSRNDGNAKLSVHLHFEEGALGPELSSATIKKRDGLSISVARSPIALAEERTFSWSKGVWAVTVLLIRSSILEGYQLVGGKKSLAGTLRTCLHESKSKGDDSSEVDWLSSLFLFPGESRQVLFSRIVPSRGTGDLTARVHLGREWRGFLLKVTLENEELDASQYEDLAGRIEARANLEITRFQCRLRRETGGKWSENVIQDLLPLQSGDQIYVDIGSSHRCFLYFFTINYEGIVSLCYPRKSDILAGESDEPLSRSSLVLPYPPLDRIECTGYGDGFEAALVVATDKKIPIKTIVELIDHRFSELDGIEEDLRDVIEFHACRGKVVRFGETRMTPFFKEDFVDRYISEIARKFPFKCVQGRLFRRADTSKLAESSFLD